MVINVLAIVGLFTIYKKVVEKAVDIGMEIGKKTVEKKHSTEK